jgi:hypothetical protein
VSRATAIPVRAMGDCVARQRDMRSAGAVRRGKCAVAKQATAPRRNIGSSNFEATRVAARRRQRPDGPSVSAARSGPSPRGPAVPNRQERADTMDAGAAGVSRRPGQGQQPGVVTGMPSTRVTSSAGRVLTRWTRIPAWRRPVPATTPRSGGRPIAQRDDGGGPADRDEVSTPTADWDPTGGSG